MFAVWVVSMGLRQADGLEFRGEDAATRNRAIILPGKCFLSGKHQQIKMQFCRGMVLPSKDEISKAKKQCGENPNIVVLQACLFSVCSAPGECGRKR